MQGLYDDAAKYYGRVANVVSDAELRPLATYKLIAALSKAGKEVEAEQYRKMMDTEFSRWRVPLDARRLIEAATTTNK